METKPRRPCWNCGAREAEVLVSRQELCDPCGEMYWRLLLVKVAISDAIREDIPGPRPPAPPLTDDEVREIAREVFGPSLDEVELAEPDPHADADSDPDPEPRRQAPD